LSTGLALPRASPFIFGLQLNLFWSRPIKQMLNYFSIIVTRRDMKWFPIHLKKGLKKKPWKLLLVTNNSRLQFRTAAPISLIRFGIGSSFDEPHEIGNRIILQKLLSGAIICS
jgi:hypothetical protein